MSPMANNRWTMALLQFLTFTSLFYVIMSLFNGDVNWALLIQSVVTGVIFTGAMALIMARRSRK